MNKNISKYFWDLNRRALKETGLILKNPKHPKFAQRLMLLLSRCQEPKELFSIISEADFIAVWPKLRRHWVKITRDSDFRDWWQTIFEQLAQEYREVKKRPERNPPAVFLTLARMVKDARIKMRLSQAELALRAGMKQPDISRIEEGKANLTLGTLTVLCRALRIKKLVLEK